MIRSTVLPHGLRVVSERVPSSRTFSIGFFAGVGSRHETTALHGASHFLEHVLFKGTPSRSAEQISAAIESVGGELNAYTAKEHTCFYAWVLHKDANLAVDVLSDMLANSTIVAAEVESERAVILDEIAMHGDDPGEVAAELVTARLLGQAGRRVSGLGQSVIGSPTSIAAMTRGQIVRHWRRHYQPSGLVVAAAGKVDHDRLVEQLSAFDDRPNSLTPRSSAPTRNGAPGGVLIHRIRLEQTTASLAVPGHSVLDQRRYALGLLSIIVGGGMASRLFVEVRERRGLTYGISADETAYSDAGVWSVDWQCAPEKLVPILELVRAVLSDVAEHGVTGAELARAKGQMRGQIVLNLEGGPSRMTRLGLTTLLGDRRTIQEVLSSYDRVTGEQVRAEAEALFQHAPTLAVVGPKAPPKRLDTILDRW